MKAYLSREERGCEVQGLHPYLDVADRLGFRVYHAVSLSGWAAEAVGAGILFPQQRERCDRLFWKALGKRTQGPKGHGAAICDAEAIRGALKIALETFVSDRDWQAYGLVGITVCLNQLTAALVLAKQIKAAAPDVPVVLGGSSCAGVLGPSLLSVFPQIDYVVNGEGELPLLGLVRYLFGKQSLVPTTVMGRNASDREGRVEREQISGLDSLPLPDFTDYFAEIQRLSPHKRFFPTLPVEFSRGCWWGRCRFCNLNLQWKGYRAKTAARMAAEVDTLSRRYGVLDFAFTDNVLPQREAVPFFELLGAYRRDYTFFAELRAVHRREELRRMASGGLLDVQVGIEALSTLLLGRLGKGVSTMENVAAMRHAQEVGLRVSGNLIIHFPGSTPEEVAETLETLEFVWPFRPLKTVSFWLGLASPVDREPGGFGVAKIKPHPFYADLFPREICENMSFLIETYSGDRKTQRQLWRPVERKVRQWREEHKRLGAEGALLRYRDGGDYLIVRRVCPDGTVLTHRLSGLSRRLYLACREPTSMASLSEQAAGQGADRVETFVKDLAAKRLVFRENDEVLSLAIHEKRGFDDA